MDIIKILAKSIGYSLGFVLVLALAGAVVYFLQPVAGIQVAMVLGVLIFAGLVYLIYKLLWRPGKFLSAKLLLYVLPVLPLVYSFGFAPFVALKHGEAVSIDTISALNKEILTLSKGEKIAVYSIPLASQSTANPVVFVNGGPGGPITPNIAEFLEKMAKAGYETHAFDHYSCGESEYETFDKNLLTADDEVRRLDELVNQVARGRKVNLIGSSYAGSLVSRYMTQHNDKVASYIAMDTAPLHSMYTGNMRERMAYDQADADAIIAKLEAGDSSGGGGLGVILDKILKDADSSPKAVKSLLTFFWGAPNGDYVFGRPAEASQINMNVLTTDKKPPDPRMGLFRLSMAAQVINTDMSVSPDFAEQLIALDTAPVLVVYPEHAVFDWLFFKDYANFFDKVTYLPWKGAGHGVWETRPDELIDNIKQFYATGTVSDAYTGTENPFKQ